MGEQERYKRMLKKVIDLTERKQIKSSEELIYTLVKELTTNVGVKSQHHLFK